MPYKDPEKERARQQRRRQTPEYNAYQAKYQPRWRATHPDSIINSQLRYRQSPNGRVKIRAKKKRYYDRAAFAILWFKSEHPCFDCGDTDPIVLEFDHVRGTKSFTIGETAGRRQTSLQTILAEIQKCDVVCANCHKRRTAARQKRTIARDLLQK